MSKFDIQGNSNDKYVLNFKKSSYHSVSKSVWSNDKELLKKMARLLVMENYQTVYIDETNSDLLWLHGAIHQDKNSPIQTSNIKFNGGKSVDQPINTDNDVGAVAP